MLFQNSLNGFIYLLKLNIKNKKMLSFFIAGTLISTFLLIGLFFQLFGSMRNFMYYIQSEDITLLDNVENPIILLSVIVYFLIIGTFHYCFSVFQINESLKIISSEEELHYRKLSFLKSIWLDIKFFLIFFVIMVIFALVTVFIIKNEIAVILIIFMLVLFIIPFFFIRMSLYKITYTIGMADCCLRNSFSLTKNKFWKIFGVFFVASSLQNVISGILMSIALNFPAFLALILTSLSISMLYFLNTSIITVLPISIYYSLINGKPLSKLEINVEVPDISNVEKLNSAE